MYSALLTITLKLFIPGTKHRWEITLDRYFASFPFPPFLGLNFVMGDLTLEMESISYDYKKKLFNIKLVDINIFHRQPTGWKLNKENIDMLKQMLCSYRDTLIEHFWGIQTSYKDPEATPLE